MSRQTARVFALQLPPEERAAYVESVSKSGARVAGGVRAVDIGASWERWLSAQHQAAHREGIAKLRKVGPPIARTGPGGQDIKVVGFGPADFQGAIRGERAGAPWLPLALEAKSRAGRLQRREIDDHQHDDLAWVASVGGVALVVIELHDDRGAPLGRWAIPWAQLERRWKVSERAAPSPRGAGDATATAKKIVSMSAGPDELAGWEVPAQGCYLARFVGGGA